MGQAGTCKMVHVGHKGTGYALFSSKEEVEVAITNLNGCWVKNNEIQVDRYTAKDGSEKKAKPWGKSMGKGAWGYPGVDMSMMYNMAMMQGGGKGKGKGKGSGVQHPERTVWIGGLAEGTTHTDLMP